MPPRRQDRATYPSLGAFFAQYKRFPETKGWSADAEYAQRNGYRSLKRLTLMRLAEGKTKFPSDVVLREFSECYGVSYDLLVGVVAANAYESNLLPGASDLLRHSQNGLSDLTKAGGHDTTPADARVLELQSRIARANENIGRLVEIIADSSTQASRLAEKLLEGADLATKSLDARPHRSGGSQGG